MNDEKRAERFNHLMTKWIEYCRDPRVQKSATASRVWTCPPYRGIIRLGPDVLPLVKHAYESDVTVYVESPDKATERAYDIIRIFGLEAILNQLCGFSAREDLETDFDRREHYAKEALEDYLNGEPSAKNTRH